MSTVLVPSYIGTTQHPLPRRIVEVPFLLTIDRTAPPHQTIEPIVLEGAGDPSSYLAGRVAPTIIGARVVHRPLARTGRRRGGLRQVAELVGMRTITIEILLLSAASIQRPFPYLAQIGVGILVGVIASQRALVPGTATRPIACRRNGGVVAGPDQAVLLVITEVLDFASSSAALSGDGGFRGRSTEHIAHGIVADLIVEERRPVALLDINHHLSPSQGSHLCTLMSPLFLPPKELRQNYSSTPKHRLSDPTQPLR